MLDFDMLPLSVGVLLTLVISLILKGKKSYTYLLFFNIFSVYIIYVVKYTIFPIPVQAELLALYKQQGASLHSVNVVPFSFVHALNSQVFLNILLSVPFGFGISYIAKVGWKKVLLLGVLFGTCIESVQYGISSVLQFTYRAIDLDDLILNFTGVVIGYVVYKLYSSVFTKIYERNKLQGHVLLDYIYNVSKGEPTQMR